MGNASARIIGLIVLIFLSCERESPDENISGNRPEDSIQDISVESEDIMPLRNYSFEDGFEVDNNNLNELFPDDGSRWTTIQQVDPAVGVNEMEVVSSPMSEGTNSLRIFSVGTSDSLLSKIDIEKGNLVAQSGDRVTITADFYINSDEILKDLFLLDFECCSCWDPNVDVENKCPGIRLTLTGNNDVIALERGKISQPTIVQSAISFPRNQWVTLRWEMKLSQKNNGKNSIFLNNVLFLEAEGMNMPNSQIFKETFAKEGIDFQLQEPVTYERLQIGATANPSHTDVELFVDNVKIEIIEE